MSIPPPRSLTLLRDDLERLAQRDAVSREVEHAPRAARFVEEQAHRAVERPRERDRCSPWSGWNENVIVACTSTSRRSALGSRHAATSNGAAGPIVLRLDGAGDRAGELAVLDPQPVHPPFQPVTVHERGQRRRGSASGIARVRAHERGGDRTCARRLRRVVGCHLVGAAGPVGPDVDALHATATTTRRRRSDGGGA